MAFGVYDLAHNTKHGNKIDVDDLPILRIYRKEDNYHYHFTERYNIQNVNDFIRAYIDILYEVKIISYL